MSVLDTGLPFFGVQAGARGERVSVEKRVVGLAVGTLTHITGPANGPDDIVRIAAALAVLLFRYTYEPTVVIGMAEQESGRHGDLVVLRANRKARRPW